MNFDRIFKLLPLTILIFSFTACATNTKRSDFDNDCDYARAHYEEMQESARVYYALGKTTVVEMAAVERRVKKAKDAVAEACED